MSRSCVVIHRVIQVDHAHEERLVALALTFFFLVEHKQVPFLILSEGPSPTQIHCYP